MMQKFRNKRPPTEMFYIGLQLLILCGIGIPIGLVLGTLSAKGVLIAATSVLNPDIFMVNSASELTAAISAASSVKLPMLLASVAVTLFFALLAAFPAARYASRVSPTVAMSGHAVKIKRRGKRNRKIYHFESYYARKQDDRSALALHRLREAFHIL